MSRLRHSCVAVCAFAAFGVCGLRGSDDLEKTRAVIEEWIETEGKIAQEATAWSEEKSMLENVVVVLESEKEVLNAKLSEHKEEKTEAEENKAALIEQKESLETTRRALLEEVVRLEQSVRELVPLFPKPLREKVDPFLKQFIAAEGDPLEKLSLPKRFQNVIGVLTVVEKFNNDILLENELLDREDGSTLMVKRLYFGLGQAFALNTANGLAQIGIPGKDGWEWEDRPDLMESISALFSVYENPQNAAFVTVPIVVK